MRFTASCVCVLALILLPACGGKKDPAQPDKPKEGLVKRTTKAATETALEAVDAVGEAVDEHGKKTAETITRAAGEVAAGIAAGANASMEKHGAAIGSNLVSAAAPVVAGAVEEGFRQANSPTFSNLEQRITETHAAGSTTAPSVPPLTSNAPASTTP